jgi:hypothetical protein
VPLAAADTVTGTDANAGREVAAGAGAGSVARSQVALAGPSTASAGSRNALGGGAGGASSAEEEEEEEAAEAEEAEEAKEAEARAPHGMATTIETSSPAAMAASEARYGPSWA